jgi:hypothetical protein
MSRSIRALPVLVFTLGLVAAGPALARQDAHAAHAGHAAHAAPPAPSQSALPAHRYATDAALRSGMADIRSAVGMLDHASHGHLDAAQVRSLASNIERSIGGIVANCTLDPQADAALHGIIGRLGAGVSALKERPGDAAPIAQMRDALEDYARMFDDPGAATVARNAAS